MPITSLQATRVLEEGRRLIGKTYADFDCSHFVCEAYFKAELPYDYAATGAFASARAGIEGPFKLVPSRVPQPADVLLFSGHMGLWDPQGCAVLGTNNECKRLRESAPLLSSRSGGNRGPDFGIPAWWGNYRVFRWEGYSPAGINSLRLGQVIQPRLNINPVKVANWKYASECASVGAGLTGAAELKIVEINSTMFAPWIRVEIPGSDPARYLKIAGDEYAANFKLIR